MPCVIIPIFEKEMKTPHPGSLPFYLLYLLIFAGSFTACKKTETPGAFFIKAYPVTVNPAANQGSANHKITDLWLYVNGNFQGVYPSGHLMPIPVNNQSARIEVFAGIRNNGISETRIPWLFYQKLRFDTVVENGQNIVKALAFTYNTTTTFAWLEDFDGTNGISLVKSSISDTGFVLAPADQSLEGKSALLGMGPLDVVAQVESTKTYTLPSGNSNVYLELNYKCDHAFEVGLISSSTELKPALNLNPQASWNKIYIQLAGVVNSQPVSANYSYKVYFRMLNSDGSSPRLYLDNIKLVYL
ncbi:MAG TPA: hypothetical protein PLQ93_04820 [Bacteroidia bacterium]|nr:hypothetical protein [Bacteroidia bacterium]